MTDPNKKTDEQNMREALMLAAHGRGYVSPNPLVGCIIVDKNNKVIGKGWHKKFGEAHAEVNAIRDAEKNGHIVAGATVYVNLEPCSHQGKTSACADLLIEKNIARCVIGIRDPYSLVDGKGIEKLNAAGIKITEGILEAQAFDLNKFFIKFVRTNSPYITLKLGMSLDGKTALKSGISKWITSESSRKAVHNMRAEYDAVLVASATVLADNPELTVRMVEGRSPRRIILDANLRVPETAKVYSDENAAQTIVIATEQTLKEKSEIRTLLSSRGITFIAASALNNQFILKDVFAKLGRMDIASVLVEPGPTLATVLLQEKLFDELVLFVAPILLGGDARSAFGDLHLKNFQQVHRLQMLLHEAVEDSEDLKIVYRSKDLSPVGTRL